MSKKPQFVVKFNKFDNFDRNFKETDIGFKTTNSTYFKKIMSFIGGILDSANFKFTDAGMSITSLDNNHISLVDMLIPANFFSIYNFKSFMNIGINIPLLVKILNQINSNDTVIFKINNNQDKIEIVLLNSNYEKKYELKLIEIDNEDIHQKLRQRLVHRY